MPDRGGHRRNVKVDLPDPPAGAEAGSGEDAPVIPHDDGSAPDRDADAASVDARSPLEDAGVLNLLVNGDFEFDCANWAGANGATIAPDPEAHTGNQATNRAASVPTPKARVRGGGDKT